jgi:hypothetical protein
MIFLQCLGKGVDKTPVKEVSPRSAAMKKANVEEKTTSSKWQKIEDTSSDLAKAVLSFVNILSQIEIAIMAIQASIENNKLEAQLSMHDSTLNQNRELADMKQHLQLILAKQEMEIKLALAGMKRNKSDKEIEDYKVIYVFIWWCNLVFIFLIKHVTSL